MVFNYSWICQEIYAAKYGKIAKTAFNLHITPQTAEVTNDRVAFSDACHSYMFILSLK